MKKPKKPFISDELKESVKITKKDRQDVKITQKDREEVKITKKDREALKISEEDRKLLKNKWFLYRFIKSRVTYNIKPSREI